MINNVENQNTNKTENKDQEKETSKRKSNKELIIFENDDYCSSDKKNLQDGFQNFMKIRKVNIILINLIQDLRKANNTNDIPTTMANPSNMQVLREKFVKTAKNFLGIPYGKKYLKEDPSSII